MHGDIRKEVEKEKDGGIIYICSHSDADLREMNAFVSMALLSG